MTGIVGQSLAQGAREVETAERQPTALRGTFEFPASLKGAILAPKPPEADE